MMKCNKENLNKFYCVVCKKETIRKTKNQMYCKQCSIMQDKERKRKHYLKNNPNAYKEKEKKYCSFCGSDNIVSSFKKTDLFCQKHYNQMYLHGMTFLNKKEREKTNKYVFYDNHISIITKHNKEILIDKNAFEKAKMYSWCVSRTGYSVANIKGKVKKMHRYLYNFTSNIVDHINGNKLDNRLGNLRECTQKENSRNLTVAINNSSGCTGVSLVKSSNKWRARIMVNRKEILLGYFVEKKDAIKARKEAEIKYFGEFRRK